MIKITAIQKGDDSYELWLEDDSFGDVCCGSRLDRDTVKHRGHLLHEMLLSHNIVTETKIIDVPQLDKNR